MKIAVLVSGGVDSSVALALLKSQGLDVTAFYIKIWLDDELSYLGDCPWQEDLAYVEDVCKQLGVPLEVVSLQKEYWEKIVSYTISEAKAGRTPNPDILCNQQIKFGVFYERFAHQFDKIATGHYAQVKYQNGQYLLKKSPDKIKDQTYFLSYLSQEQLSRIVFPIGHLEKKEIRALAKEYNLPTQDRKDSQGLCFLGKISFSDFLKHHLGEKEGDLVEYETGKKMGIHRGFWFYTVGQRQGIGLSGGPWYVVEKSPEDNIVYISKQYHSEDKIRKKFRVEKCNWISSSCPQKKELQVKLRHGEHVNKCLIEPINHSELSVTLYERDHGIAAGQFAVFYDNNICLGGGRIVESDKVYCGFDKNG